MALPLGTVVNAVFKNQAWLYVQTPHGQEGYVGYAACLPLGILPQPTHGPCWEDSTDVFPRPLGKLLMIMITHKLKQLIFLGHYLHIHVHKMFWNIIYVGHEILGIKLSI